MRVAGQAERRFPTTRWTSIRAAQQDPGRSEQLLADLLPRYWQPLYCYLRRKGLDADAAGDAVQGVCTRLLERGFLRRLDATRGSLRAFLKAAADRYLIDAHWHAKARKRGGDLRFVSLDALAQDGLLPAAVEPGAESVYEREWALGVFERALAALREDYTSGRRQGDFAVVERFFRPSQAPSYAQAAADSGCTPQQFKAGLHRARLRFRELVYAELRADGSDGEQALARLFDGLGT
jgi:RNA polymerase sigma-70 factor (ECF subfamily)